MKNRITVSLPFSFKGKTLCPRSTIDLDEHMELTGIPCLYTHIADENGIDIYSYEHDVMMMAELEFEQVEGMVAEFIRGGHFDSEGFQTAWKQEKLKSQLQEIATRCIGSDSPDSNLDHHAALKSALLEAYELGRKAFRSEQSIRSTTDPLF